MTRIGSPLWAAPEVLGGRRYCEHVDTYSLGVVMFEIAVRAYPYAKRLREFKSQGGKGMDMQLMRGIADGKRRIQLEGEGDDVSPAFKKLFRRCVAFEPEERPSMQEVAQKLEEILSESHGV